MNEHIPTTTPELTGTEVVADRDAVRIVAAVSRTERGMTLVEIMIVLTIMASIMGIVGFFARGALDNSRRKEAEAEVGNLSQMITQFYVFSNEYPDSLDQLVNPPAGMSPIAEEVPLDPWGNDYQYSKDGNSDFEISSMGPDGSSGGGDDICPGGPCDG